ncbi:MAG: type II secretion system protein N [Candidatus Thiodiazotropha sp.]|nr:hypothetical protein [Candidatus Thiodiazotropha sp. (ex Lucina pensylvanica)]MBT3061398.1 hypothetical protein [Candidatus Thiodiazotropha sp. (ex Lucina pensylvanica)]MBV2095275.1 hypothetical protein [Candidatus Thiodiazotropha sp. (ex Codakia orbicularis)]PUB76891.1 MAG: hypothetical protein DBO99_12385 [gamma proteobacterium symbiont of Ctena orbiculata]
MSSWRFSINNLTLLLLLAIGAMCANLYYQWRSPFSSTVSAAEQTPDQAESAESGNRGGGVRFVPISIKAYNEITQRPLFVEGRLPPAEPEPKTAGRTASKPLRLKLEGVAMMPQNKVAIIRDLETNELYRVSQGMNKNDWKVESVDSESATVIRKGVKLELKLELEEKPVKQGRQTKRRAPARKKVNR